MKNVLLVVGGVSLSTIMFIVLFPIIILILLIKLFFTQIDNHN